MPQAFRDIKGGNVEPRLLSEVPNPERSPDSRRPRQWIADALRGGKIGDMGFLIPLGSHLPAPIVTDETWQPNTPGGFKVQAMVNRDGSPQEIRIPLDGG